MNRLTVVLLFTYTGLVAQSRDQVSFGAGFAHFDDTDGFEINASYLTGINRYFSLELKLNFANTNDFPDGYRFSEQLEQNYWFTKSSILNFSPNLHLMFVNEKNNQFSLYGGVGVMHINAADQNNLRINPDQFVFESTIESYFTLSRTIGFQYTYFIKNYGFGLDANLVSPLRSTDQYFGQDNFRTVGLFLTKRF